MIINIPLVVDEKKMEEVLERDYSGKVIDRIEEYIKTTLKNNAETYYGDKVDDGMRVLIEKRIDKYLETANKEQVLERAAVLLADKLARSKRGKQILEEL